MENEKRKSVVGLSLVTAMLLGSSAYAGKIITDADVNNIVVEENKQFGFGGWNFDNIDVRIVDVADFSGSIGDFNTTTGIYSAMTYEESFESDISTGGEIRGHLHGKDWPVGEPAGIKIINDDNEKLLPKPLNCIMTSSYVAYQIEDDETSGTGYLDAWPTMPKPTLCSSSWQAHKRFKINLLPTTVDVIDPDGYGKPVDLVFNLDQTDTDTVARRYQVLQKVNNYTGKRLDGYKVEVLGGDGLPNAALTFSLGLGEGDPDIWDENEMANYSHGLWGPYQKVGNVVRFDNGFFDFKRSYYPVALSDSKQTISYTGDMLGGNYQGIFGNWLPSTWAPMGIFNDDDNDPETDGILEAFYGVAPGETDLRWWSRTVADDPEDAIDPIYTWTAISEDDVDEMLLDPLFSEDHVEDVLNLGLNYIIEVGNNAEIGSTFTLRLTPHVSTNQTEPIYVNPPSNTAPVADAGDDLYLKLGEPITIIGTATDADGDETIRSYSWSDGSTVIATTASFEYTPNKIGRVILTLTVMDNRGATGTDTTIVKVRPNDPQPQGPKK